MGLDQHVPGLRAVAAGVHRAGAADGPGHAAIELQPRDPRLAGLARQIGVERRGAGVDGGLPARLDPGEGPAQADHHPLDPPVADQEVGADTDGNHRHGGIQSLQEAAQVVLVFGQEQHFGRAADPEPGVGRQHRVLQQLAADGREPVTPAAHALDSAFRPSGRA